MSFLNAHNANIACTDPAFAEALDDFLILPDGIGVDIAAKILYGAPFPANLNGTDFVPAFLQAVDAAADGRPARRDAARMPKRRRRSWRRLAAAAQFRRHP